jgi:hypothetical protein
VRLRDWAILIIALPLVLLLAVLTGWIEGEDNG